MMLNLSEALDAYRDAVEARSYWEDNGTYRDEHLRDAKRTERDARKQVVRLFGEEWE